MHVLTRYLASMYLARFCLLLFGISAFVLSLDLVTQADNIVEKSGGENFAVAKYTMLKLPQIVSESIKFSCLLAGLLTLVSLMRHNQLAPIWDGGLSQFGIVRRLTPVALLIGVLQFVLDDALVPPAKLALQEWGVVSQGAPEERNAKAATSANWIKVDNDIVRIPHGMLQHGNISDFIIFRRNKEGQLVSRLDVTTAKSEKKGWMLEGVVRRNIGGGGEILDHLGGWGSGFKPKDIDELTLHPRDLAFHRLFGFVSAEAQGLWAPHLYAMWLQFKISVCFIPLLMMFLVVALSQRYHRTGRTEVLFVIGLALGFAFFITNGIGLAMGEVGILPPVIAAWAATLGFVAIAGAMAFSREVLSTSGRYKPDDAG